MSPRSSIQRYSEVGRREGGSLGVGDEAGGAGGGFGIQTHVYGVVVPSPRSTYRPFGYSTTFGTGATEIVLRDGGA